MERIRSIEQLRLQKELLEIQRMIAELRMKQDIHLLKRKVRVTNFVLPSIKQLLKLGVKSGGGKQLLFSTVVALGKKMFSRKSRSSR